MSPQAVAARLEDLASLYELGMSLAKAKVIGPVNPSSWRSIGYRNEAGAQHRRRKLAGFPGTGERRLG